MRKQYIFTILFKALFKALFVASTFVTILCGHLNAFAAEMPLVHKPILAEALPLPGQTMKLMFLLPMTKDLGLKARASVVIDGEAMDITMEGSLDELDRTFFEAEIRAPLTELSYKFYVSGSGDRVVTTDRYQILRSCLPSTQLTTVDVSEDLPKVERARLMVELSKGLEQDIQAYQGSVDILKELQERLK